MRRKIELTNTFHNTRVTIMAPVHRDGEPQRYISTRVYRRARRTLCPSKGCTCSQSMASGPDYDRLGYLAGPNAR